MEKLIQNFQNRLKATNLTFKRYLWSEINWDNRLIAISGARGVGKSTLLLQYIKEHYKQKLDETLYVSLDNLYFTKYSLSDFAEQFVKSGGKNLFMDELHKYPNWSQEIKHIYDSYPELKIVITGSSVLDLLKGKVDLSRRMIIYKLNGLSFREFLQFKYNFEFPAYSLHEIMNNSSQLCFEINEKIKPLKYFDEYIRTGYFPYFKEGEKDYYTRVEQTVSQIIESDLLAVEMIDYAAVYNIRRLLSVLSEVVPYKPNILQLSKQLDINRDTLLKYLHLLHRAELLLLLGSSKFGLNKLNKPEKVYLNNTNLMYALSLSHPNADTLRETFFYNQVKVNNIVSYTEQGDFKINNRFIFEIGGKHKTNKQISELTDAFIAADNNEYTYKNTIPLWLFGFLY